MPKEFMFEDPKLVATKFFPQIKWKTTLSIFYEAFDTDQEKSLVFNDDGTVIALVTENMITTYELIAKRERVKS